MFSYRPSFSSVVLVAGDFCLFCCCRMTGTLFCPSPPAFLGVDNQRAIDFDPIPIAEERAVFYNFSIYAELIPAKVDFRKQVSDFGKYNCLFRRCPRWHAQLPDHLLVGQCINYFNLYMWFTNHKLLQPVYVVHELPYTSSARSIKASTKLLAIMKNTGPTSFSKIICEKV